MSEQACCVVFRVFLFALEVRQLVIVFCVGICGIIFQMPDQNVGTIFRVRFDIVLVLLGFCFILIVVNEKKVKVCPMASFFFSSNKQKNCP